METKKNIGEAKIVGQPKAPFRFKLKDGCVKSNHLAEESVATGNIQNAAVSTEKIMDEAVTNAKIMNGAITNSKISNGTITNEKIANNSIDNSKIQNLTLTGDKFTDNSIDGSKIKDNSVPGSKLADGAIESIDLQDNTLSGSKLADNSVDGDKLVDGAVTSEKLKDNSIDGSKIADGTIQSLDIKDGTISGAKLVDGTITGDKLADGIINNNKIANNSITGDKFLDESISGEKIASNTIHGRKLEDNTVDGADIIEGTLNGSKIADMSIDGDKLADDSIETRHIKSNTISGSKIVTNSIDSTKIRNNSLIGENFADEAITNAKIVDDAVTNSKIANNTIASDKIADGAITTAKLANSSIGGTSIADNAITNAKLQDDSIVNRNIATGTLTGDKFVDNTITGDKILDNTISGSKIKDGTIENVDIKDNTLSGAKLVDNSINGSKIADNAITSSHLLDNSIPASKILDGTIESIDIKDGTLDGSKVKDNTITGAKLADNVITSAKLSDNSVTTNKIVDNSVITAKIADSAVTGDKLADGAITSDKIADDAITELQTIMDEVPTKDSVKPIQSGGVLAHGSAFDVSEYNKSEGVLATYETLSAALAAVPANVRKGGMSVKFVLSSDNNYVQFRYMSSSTAVADFTNIANWQGVDDVPTAGSKNLVESGGVFNELNINESETPPFSDFMRYGATSNIIGTRTTYVSRANRVSVKLPSEIYEVTFSSIASGYHAALQESYTQDPTQGLPTMSGTVVADSGWVESNAVPKTIQKKQSTNYPVVTIAKIGNKALSVSEAISAVSFSYTLQVGKFERLSEQVSELDLQLNGADYDVVYDNTNMSSANWITYTSSSNSRGRYYIKIPDFVKTYNVSFSVASNSTILVGGSLGTSKSQNSNYIYDSGWIHPGGSVNFGNASDPSGEAAYILINTRYVDTDSASTYNEFAQYCTISVHITFKTGGIVQDINIKKKCLLSATNVKMVAHRGFHLNDVPENSIDAYRWAGYLGFDLAETDFCPTADDELVLMHDASINRTMKNIDNTAISDTVNVVSKTLAELRENYVLASNDPRYRRPIPTLEEYFITCRESNIFPIPEIKQSGTTQEHVLAAYNIGKRIMGAGNFGFCSFSYELLDYARSLDENIPLWYIGTSILGTNNSITGQSRETSKNVWYPSYTGTYSYSAELVAQYHAKGMQVAVWTVPISQFDNRLKDGVDYIATDNSGSNLSKIEGVVFDETDMETTGNLTNSGIFLAAGQHATIQGDFMEIGIYYVSVIASGNYAITAPNLSETINDADYTRRVWQGLIDNKSATITITAVGDTTIQFVNAKIVLVK